MRLRNVKNKETIMEKSKFLMRDEENYRGKWNSVFKNNNPIEIEIGTGKGNFIIEKALTNTNINYIGIERYDSVIVRALERIPDSVTNLKLIRMNAIDIDKIFDKEVCTIYLNFSDPWPKKKYQKRRLSSAEFLEIYRTILSDNGKILMKTDNQDLFEDSVLYFMQNGFTLTDFSVNYRRKEHPEDAITEYESRFMAEGMPIYRLCAVDTLRKGSEQ